MNDSGFSMQGFGGGQGYLPSMSSWGMPPAQDYAYPSQDTPGAAPMWDTPGGLGNFAKPASGGGFMDAFSQLFGTTNKDGIKTNSPGMNALGAANGIFNAWMGMKQYGLAKQSLAEGKRQFGLNYDAQRTTTNAQLEDRQRARVASNAGAYQSVGDYMSANGVKGG